MKNVDKFIPKIEKTYQVQELEVKRSNLSLSSRESKIINRSGGNYQSLRASISNPSYGPGIDGTEVKKYCSSCKKDKEVESSDKYCSGCGKEFGVSETSVLRATLVASCEKKIDPNLMIKFTSLNEKKQ